MKCLATVAICLLAVLPVAAAPARRPPQHPSPPAGNANTAATPAPALPDILFPRHASSVELPLIVSDGHLFVGGTVGKGKQRQGLSLLLATAAGGAIDGAAADRLGLQTLSPAGQPQTVRVDDLALAGVTIPGLNLPRATLADLSNQIGRPVDAVIGTEWIHRLIIEVDFVAGRLLLLPAERLAPPAEVAPENLIRQGAVVGLAVRIDNVPATLAIDTTAPTGIVLAPDFVARNGLGGHWESGLVLAAAADAPAATERLARAESLEIGGTHIAHPLVRLSDHGLPAGFDGSIGTAILRHFDTILDVKGGRIWLRPTTIPAADEPHDHAGLTVHLEDGRVTVAAVLPGGPAARAKLQIGDIIDWIGANDAATLGLAGTRERLDGLYGAVLTLKITRGNEEPKHIRLILSEPLAPPTGEPAP